MLLIKPSGNWLTPSQGASAPCRVTTACHQVDPLCIGSGYYLRCSSALPEFGGGLFALTSGNQQTESGSNSMKAPEDASSAPQTTVESRSQNTKAPKDQSGPHQRTVSSQSESGGDNTKAVNDELAVHQRMIIVIPGDKTLAEWAPGCLYEVRAEKQASGAWRACFGFDPSECFVADAVLQLSNTLHSGTAVFVTLSAARDRWAAGTLSTISDARYYVKLDTGLECTTGGKPGVWVGADGVIAPRKTD